MTQVITGMITNAGIALAEAPSRQRKRIRRIFTPRHNGC